MFEDLNKYSTLIKYNIFNIEENIQFKLLFDDFSRLFKSIKCNTYCLVERSYLYEGKSIFAPFLNLDRVTDIVDYRPSKAKLRKSSFMKNLKQFHNSLPSNTSVINDDEEKMFFSGKRINSDTIVIPNVVHHCRDLNKLIEIILSKSKKVKYLYIFDSYLREEHQEPNDYARFTISGLKHLMLKYDFEIIKKKTIGNIFDGLVYLINQTESMEKKFLELESITQQLFEIKKRLLPIANKKKYQKLFRKHASFSSAYSVLFERK